MFIKLKTAYAYKGETLNVGDVIAVDNTLADSLLRNGYAVCIDDDDDDDEQEALLFGKRTNYHNDIKPPVGTDGGGEPTEGTDGGSESTEGTDGGSEPTEGTGSGSEPTEAETIPLGRSVKKEKEGKK